jgi:hypothetical protein
VAGISCAAGGIASMGGVFVVQADKTSRKPARREYKATSRRQPLMNSPSESTRTSQRDREKWIPAFPKKIMLHQRREANDYSLHFCTSRPRPFTARQDASHFLPNTWPAVWHAWWRVFAGPARAISIPAKTLLPQRARGLCVLDSLRGASYVPSGLMALSGRECQAFIITKFSINARRATSGNEGHHGETQIPSSARSRGRQTH